MNISLRPNLLFPAVVLAVALSFVMQNSFAGDIKATFVEDKKTVVIKLPIIATTDLGGLLLARLKENKIDCGPKCVPKSVGDGVWECCDGRRVPPKGKVLITIQDIGLRHTARAAFTRSHTED